MALAKASEIAALNPHAWVLGADTVVSIGGRILGKPRDRNDALAILKLLVGRTHQVITGVSLCHRALGFEETFVDLTLVTFAQFPDDILSAYVRTGEPLDKAGAYGIQGIGSFLARGLNGSCTNVIGLPVDLVVSILLSRGVIEFRA
jgi:septum formation protein